MNIKDRVLYKPTKVLGTIEALSPSVDYVVVTWDEPKASPKPLTMKVDLEVIQ